MTNVVPSESNLTLPLRLLRRALPVAMGVVLLLGIGGGVRLALSLGQPFPGFAIVPRKELRVLAVIWTTPPHWPGIAAGMQINDLILCIDGYNPRPDARAPSLDPRHLAIQCPEGEKKWTQLFRERFDISEHSTVQFLVDRGGKVYVVPDVPLVVFDPVMLVEIFLPLFLLSIGMLAVGAAVYRANPMGEINLIFALLTTGIAGMAADWLYVARISDQLEDTVVITLILSVFWAPFLGAILFHLTTLLTEEGSLRSLASRFCLPYYLLSAGFWLLGSLAYILHDDSIDYWLAPLFYYFIIASCVFSLVWSIISLGWTFRKTPSRQVRRQVGLVLLGWMITLAVVILLAGLYFNTSAWRYIHTVPYFGLAVVAIFAYAILRYQLFASRTQILTMLLVAISCILAANLVYLAVGQTAGFLPILAAATVASLGLEVRRGPTSFLNRLLRRETLDYQTVTRFGRRVGGLQQIDSLLQAARQSLEEDLDVEHLDVWLLDPENQAVDRFCDGQPSGSTAIPPALVEHLLSQPSPVHASSASVAGYAAPAADAEPNHVAVWAPLVDRGQAVGMLGLGPRWTGEVYDEKDLELVGILARQLALSILNTRQLERLQATSRLVLQAEENERRKIARELHDTILQFLLVLTYGLDDLKERQAEMAAEIERWQDRISAEAGQLRGLLNYLRAPEVLVQHGLALSLQTWLEQVRLETTASIQADLAPEAGQALPVEAQVAIYRVFREAIHNALKHARGSQVVARLWPDGDYVRFSVQDDGQGFDVARALQGGGKGYGSLQDMRVYVESVGGRLDIHSTPGKETMVSGWVPVGTAADDSG